MKVIVAGSRSITDEAYVHRILNKFIYKITEVVSGQCRGPDTFGENWANLYQIPIKPFPADWERYGKQRAGRIRNEEMADYADFLIAFHDGVSTGTAHMMQCMKTRKKPYMCIDYNNISLNLF